MEDQDTLPAERARMFAVGARRNYERGGNVAPMIALCCESKVVMVMAAGGTDDQPAQFGGIALMLVGRFAPHTIVTVTEVWKREYREVTSIEEGEALTRGIQRGDLGRDAAAGDATVQTALMTTAWRINDEECHSVVDTVVEGGYDRLEQSGVQQGHFADMVLGGWTAGLIAPAPPASVTDQRLFQALADSDLATVVQIESWDDEPTTERNHDG